MPINKYFLSALSAFIIWGFFSLALKPLTNYASLDILFFRVFIATAFLLGINLLFRKSVVVEAKKTFKELSKKKQKNPQIIKADKADKKYLFIGITFFCKRTKKEGNQIPILCY